jgi:CBS domain-containing protein
MTIAAILGHKGREVISVTADQSVGEAVAILATRRVGAVPVMDGALVVGIFSRARRHPRDRRARARRFGAQRR